MATDDRAVAIVGLLAAPDRLRVVAAIVLGASTVDEIKSATGLGVRAVGRALARLADAGLVIRDDERRHWVVEESFRRAAIEAAPDHKAEIFDATDDKAKVLRAFVRDGRLASIPAPLAKRRIVLDYLAQDFEPGQRYTERQVNAMLARWHDDVASLRRHLVDEEFLERDVGGAEYWRAGGSYAVE
ncbi:MAG: DUF2087 domain-containing protein [Acidimicrobiales bacterium]